MLRVTLLAVRVASTLIPTTTGVVSSPVKVMSPTSLSPLMMIVPFATSLDTAAACSTGVTYHQLPVVFTTL